jgi:CRISPR/Cas system-associated exonuclease Cas4 (RecB family)
MQRKKANLYKPGQKETFNVSRSKIDYFLECPQCFYLDRRLGITRPDMPGWSLNSAVDTLLKNEFDLLREKQIPHALMADYNVADTVPYSHPDLAIWRDDYNKKIGASFFHKETNLNICGIIDDIWRNQKTGELYIVDYKSTSTDYPISLDSEYKAGYKRQMEIYQWIFRKLGFNISPIGYFLFANAYRNRDGFWGKLEFKNSIIPYKGSDSWIEPTILEIKKCLERESVPEPGKDCDYCAYRKLIQNASLKNQLSLI